MAIIYQYRARKALQLSLRNIGSYWYIVPRLQAFLRKPNRDILFATIGQH